MLKYACAVVSIIYCLTAAAQELFVQSSVVTDLYGNAPISAALSDTPVILFKARQFAHDSNARSRTTLAYVIMDLSAHLGVSTVIYLGEPLVDASITEVYVPVLVSNETNLVALQARSIFNPSRTDVYVINDRTHDSKERRLLIESSGLEAHHYEVQSLQEMRSVLRSLSGLTPGTLVLNAFSLRDDWNRVVKYRAIEQEFVSFKSPHVDVGVCIPGFRTSFALGPSIEDVSSLLVEETYSIGSCVNLNKATTKWNKVYRSTMGRYDYVE